jgi:single-strand DNA-binding protein
MSQENQITLRGYLTAEPKFYQKTPEAAPLAEIRVGSTPRRLNRETGEWQDLPTSYYRVKCWRRLAINAASSLKKGDMVIIRGHFYMHNWIDNQQRPRSTLEIEADTVGHDLAYGWSHYLRGTRPSGKSAGVNSGETARQDTGAADSGEGDGEYVADLVAAGPDESQEAAPPPDIQAEPWHPRFADDAAADARDAQRTEGAGPAGEEGDTPGPGDASDASGATSGLDSLISEADSLEREAVPF